MMLWQKNQRRLIKNGLVVSSGFLLFTSCQQEEKPPNLVYIFSDQQAFDMVGCYGNDQIITPNIDYFATQGTRFTNCFVNASTCTPYRGMLMTGQHPLYTGAIENDKPLIPGNGKKFAEVLRDAGYNTAYIGKWHLLGGDRNRPIPRGEMRYGFDEVFYTNNCHVDFRAGHCFFWNDDDEKEYFDVWEVYGQTNQALEFLDSRKGNDNPFALFVSWHPPHDWGLFLGEDGNMHYRYDAPEELMAYYERENIQVRPGMQATPDLLRMYHGHMAMTTGVDIAFGQVMDKLEELGLNDNTIVVFTSDHGDMLEFSGTTRPWPPKQYIHDYSSRVPFIIRWPGKIQANAITNLLFSALDIMPSMLGLMGLDIPEECHGKNLSQAIVDLDDDAVDYIPMWLFRGNGWRGVVTNDYTYATEGNDGDEPLFNVLFDRHNDPYQLNNLYDEPYMQHVKEDLWELTQSWMKKYNDKFYTWSDFMAVASNQEWNSPPFIRPIDVLP